MILHKASLVFPRMSGQSTVTFSATTGVWTWFPIMHFLSWLLTEKVQLFLCNRTPLLFNITHYKHQTSIQQMNEVLCCSQISMWWTSVIVTEHPQRPAHVVFVALTIVKFSNSSVATWYYRYWCTLGAKSSLLHTSLMLVSICLEWCYHTYILKTVYNHLSSMNIWYLYYSLHKAAEYILVYKLPQCR